jgi:hypothetical protein
VAQTALIAVLGNFARELQCSSTDAQIINGLKLRLGGAANSLMMLQCAAYLGQETSDISQPLLAISNPGKGSSQSAAEQSSRQRGCLPADECAHAS